MLIDTLHVTGGHTKNPLLMELYADATGCTVIEPLADDAVLLGTGMVAATAAGLFPDLNAACARHAAGRHARAVPTRPARAALRPRLPDLPRDARGSPRHRPDDLSDGPEAQPRMPGRLSWFSRAQSIAIS